MTLSQAKWNKWYPKWWLEARRVSSLAANFTNMQGHVKGILGGGLLGLCWVVYGGFRWFTHIMAFLGSPRKKRKVWTSFNNRAAARKAAAVRHGCNEATRGFWCGNRVSQIERPLIPTRKITSPDYYFWIEFT